ncbi:phosphodiesterase [Amphritea sp.]|uniref:phosphodiesterase n=1 Tax=Amphritea sp. TaxID=1872502 RepID=UPI003A8EB7E7
MLIAQITDFHVGRIIETTAGPIDLYHRLLEAVDHINALDAQPDLVVITGDISNHGREEDYIRTKAALDTLKMPYLIVPGNHDHRQRVRDIFSDHGYLQSNSNFLNYTIEELPLRLIALDTLDPGQHHGLLCNERLQWLEQTLSEQPNKPTLIFMHHPPAPVQYPYMDAMNCKNGDKMKQIIEQHRQVKAIACGHLHRDATVNWADTLLFVTGSSAFSYDLLMDEVPDIDPVFEPGICRLFYWSENTGLVSHLTFIGDYPGGVTEGVPTPPKSTP